MALMYTVSHQTQQSFFLRPPISHVPSIGQALFSGHQPLALQAPGHGYFSQGASPFRCSASARLGKSRVYECLIRQYCYMHVLFMISRCHVSCFKPIYIHEICILLMASRCQGSLLDDRDSYIVVPYIYIYHDI